MSWFAMRRAAWLVLPVASAFAQQQPDIGIAPVNLTESTYTFDTAEQHKIRVVVVAKGFKHPFAVAPLPSGDALVSERGGPMRLVHGIGGSSPSLDPQPVAGLPPLEPAFRNGGLNDIVLSPEFGKNQLVYFTFNKPGKAGDPEAKPPTRQEGVVTLFRARFNGKALSHVEQLMAGESGYNGGSRLTFGLDGSLYMTTGAPFNNQAQELDNVYGKVLHLNADGSVPKNNPFVGHAGARPEIFTYGHRDQLGLTVHPDTGLIIAAEHGPNGGDEVNVILAGHNYGWPKVSFGRNYDGSKWSDSPVAEGIEQPLIVWLPSIAPSGLTFYTGDKFPNWKGNLFVGSARRGEVPRTGGLERVVVNGNLGELRRETLLTELHQRVKDVRQGPDGLLYVLTDEDDGALLRIEPGS
jgi:aldose sugar dehydrogenase